MSTYLTPGVYIEEVPSGSASLSAGATAIAAFVGFTEKAPTDDPADPDGLKPRLVTSWTQYEKLYGGFTEGAMLPHSVYGWFLNGGSSCYVVRVAHNRPSQEPGQLALPAADRAIGTALQFTSVGPADGLSVAVTPNEPVVEDGDDEPADPQPVFDLSVMQDGEVVESYSGLTFSGDNDVVSTLTENSSRVQVATEVDLDAALDAMLAMPKPGVYQLEPAPREPVQVRAASFAGSESKRHGINGLTVAEDATMVLVPDLVTAATNEDGSIDLGMWKSVQTALINHCELQSNRVAVLDAPPGMDVQQVKEWRSAVAMYDSAFAAMYYPWIKVDNPIGTNGNSEILVPPSGHMAGVWARVDESRGVWKAPANEIIRGALDVERPITKAEQGMLNPIGVNCIRPFGTRGIRVWGARTLSSDSEWRYVNVRRLFNTIEDAIISGTQYVVFEPNDQRLWAGVTRTVSSFLRGMWRDGALMGESPEQAFFVKCDAENNPPESVDEGKLIIEVGIAPVKPAEFVIFRISQLTDTGAAE